MKSQSLPWIHLSVFLISLCSSQSHQTQISYHDHCASIVPEATPLPQSYTLASSFPLKAYFKDKEGVFNQNPFPYPHFSENSFQFNNWVVLRTSIEAVFKVETRLSFWYIGNSTNGVMSRRRSSTTISLEGFWSESSGKLCMVGFGSVFSRNSSKVVDISSVLKLNNLKISTISTLASLVIGTLESLSDVTDPSHFEQVSILIFSQLNYKFTLVPKSPYDGFPWERSYRGRFCSVFSGIFTVFNLKYSFECYNDSKNCSPFGEGTGYLPSIMSLKFHQCVESERRLVLFLQFSNNSSGGYSYSFDPSTSLVGEGSWDEEKNRLFVAACKISNVTRSWGNARIEDCSIKMRLFREGKNMMGEIWRNKSVSSSGYFGTIKFHSSKYTEIERAKNAGKRFPNADSSDMSFGMSTTSYKQWMGHGFDKHFYTSILYTLIPQNMSYKMSFRALVDLSSLYASLGQNKKMEIIAEGVYDAETGSLSMIGSRTLTVDSLVCDVLGYRQFSPVGRQTSSGEIKGSIGNVPVVCES